jgi:arylsulfatase A-like enzyme
VTRRRYGKRTLAALIATVAATLPAAFIAQSPIGPAAAADNVVDCGATPHPKCNIVMIVTDDQTLGTLADLADPVNKPATGSFAGLPGLDSISGMPYLRSRPDGSWVEFTNHYASNSLCCPSRASLLSGQYNHHNAVTHNDAGALFDDTLPVNKWLQDSGYKTGLIGKYLNLYPFGRTQMVGGVPKPYVPPDWDRWLAFRADDTTPGDKKYYEYSLIDEAHNEQSFSCSAAPPLPRNDPNNCYSTDVLATAAVDFINDNAGGPFFMYFAPHGPHNSPLQNCTVASGANCVGTPLPASRHIPATPPPLLPQPPNFNEGSNPDGTRNTEAFDKPHWVDAWLGQKPRGPGAEVTSNTPGLEHQVGEYDLDRNRVNSRLTLKSIDEAVAEIVAKLKAMQVFNRTIIVFTSDNGHMFGEHKLGKDERTRKNCQYEECAHVPLLIRYPGGPNRTEHRLTSNVDFAPTFARFSGQNEKFKERGRDGKNMYQLIIGASAPTWRKQVLLEYRANRPEDTNTYERRYWGIRTRDYPAAGQSWKYVEIDIKDPLTWPNPNYVQKELYNLVADPYELNNLCQQGGQQPPQPPNCPSPATDLAARLAELKNGDRSLSIGDVNIWEGDVGNTPNGTTPVQSLARFTVTLSEPSETPVQVNYGSLNGTATGGKDFNHVLGTLTFAPGETSKSVDVTVRGDTKAPGNGDSSLDTFTVILGGAVGAPIADSSGTGTIIDDEAAPSGIHVGLGDTTVVEGDFEGHPAAGGVTAATALLTLTMSKKIATPPGSTVTVDYLIGAAGDTAAAQVNYVLPNGLTSGTITLPAGQSSASIPIRILPGIRPNDGDKFFTVTITKACTSGSPCVPCSGSACNPKVTRPTGRVTIRNDDG